MRAELSQVVRGPWAESSGQLLSLPQVTQEPQLPFWDLLAQGLGAGQQQDERRVQFWAVSRGHMGTRWSLYSDCGHPHQSEHALSHIIAACSPGVPLPDGLASPLDCFSPLSHTTGLSIEDGCWGSAWSACSYHTTPHCPRASCAVLLPQVARRRMRVLGRTIGKSQEYLEAGWSQGVGNSLLGMKGGSGP